MVVHIRLLPELRSASLRFVCRANSARHILRQPSVPVQEVRGKLCAYACSGTDG
jgi:hypothetical protein